MSMDVTFVDPGVTIRKMGENHEDNIEWKA